jgi:Homocysteine S-methyltransferase
MYVLLDCCKPLASALIILVGNFSYLQSFAEDGLVNIVGGCCGTTPDHIRYIVLFIVAAWCDNM